MMISYINKMNNTKTSWCSRKSKKPEGFRVMLKHRYNHNQKAQPALKQDVQLMGKSQQLEPKSQITRHNITDMKDYVRNRMRTDYKEENSINHSALGESKVARDEKSVSKSQHQRNQTPQRQLRGHSSLSVSQGGRQLSVPGSPIANLSSKKQNRQSISLDNLQRKIVQLLDRRLNFCVSRQSRDASLQLELEEMVLLLRNLQKEDPEAIQSEIGYLQKKIKLFQRLMAQNMTQSQVMKNYYLAKLTHRPVKRTRHSTEQHSPARKLSMHKFCDTLMRSTVVGSSISKQVFKPPQKSAYKIFKYQNKFFNADRHKQPLPRSSYNRQFLVNPPVSDQKFLPKDHNVLGKTASDKFLRSSYQANFLGKPTQKVNYRQLDAYRDKIKYLSSYSRDLSIVYGRQQKRSLSPNSYNYFLARLAQSNNVKKSHVEPLLTTKALLTESRREYVGSEGRGISSQIKHRNLLKLKHQYLRKAQN